ncbi:MAG: TVP38/TMEM64 family protein [Deltaproteobacteria bacterium]|nr:TVP38/TMEM64 family protein [Deltaproteobacteria bacterium]
MTKHRKKIIFAILWLSLFALALYSWLQSEVPLKEIPNLLHLWMSDFGLFKSASIYIILYTIRPLILFPATLLTVASGLIFGPWLGILFTIIGENASANLAFVISRWFGRDWVKSHEHGWIVKWEEKISENAIITVLIMRLIYLPFDAVNYGCGLTSMKHIDFFIGTFIGIIPGLVSFVLLGGTASATAENRLLIFGLALTFFFLGLAIARVIHRKKGVN